MSLKAESWVTKDDGFLLSFDSCNLPSDKDFASFSVFRTIKSSPDFAAPLIPSISIGVLKVQLNQFVFPDHLLWL